MTRKGGLGKGLGALIPGENFSPMEDQILHIDIDAIIPNPQQPRTEMAEEGLQELAASIREHGVLQPLIVSSGEQAGQYILIAGERRLRASRLAGLATVPAILRSASEQQRLELALIENVQRTDLSALETAEAYQMLTDQFGLSHEEIAARMGKSRVAVSNTLRLLKLATEVRQALAAGKISEGHARALLGLPTHAGQTAALQTVLDKEMNVRQTEELVRRLTGERSTRPPLPTRAPEVKDLEERLREELGTRVTLQAGKRGGRVVIHYYSGEELEAILQHILKS